MTKFEQFISNLQKETDDKWKKKIKNLVEMLECPKYAHQTNFGSRKHIARGCNGCGREKGFKNCKDQATNIIKELVK